MPEIPKIVSVDDHVIEPPGVWQDRLPASYREVGPRLDRRKVKNMQFVGGVFSYEAAGPDEDGIWCDWWLIPLIIVQLWDSELAAAEIRRNAARGCHAVTFSEIPPFLGFPSIHDKDGYWDPFLSACEETETVINMHIGSSSKMPSTSPDAPAAVGSTLTYMNAAMSLTDWLMSGTFERFPNLTLAYSEGQIGWIPYVLERADKVWEDNRAWGGVADKVKKPPSQYYREHVYGCFFDDPHGLRSLEDMGVDNITFETDYPHSDSTWPHTKKVAEDPMQDLTQAQV